MEEVVASAYADTAREFEQIIPRLFPGGVGRLVPATWDERLPGGWATVGPRPLPAWARLGIPHVPLGERAAAVRPDRYVFAAGRDPAVNAAAQDFAARWSPPPP